MALQFLNCHHAAAANLGADSLRRAVGAAGPADDHLVAGDGVFGNDHQPPLWPEKHFT